MISTSETTEALLRKDEAITLLSGMTGHGAKAKAARRMGMSKQAVGKWPDPLPPRISDRVRGVLSREPIGAEMVAAETERHQEIGFR